MQETVCLSFLNFAANYVLRVKDKRMKKLLSVLLSALAVTVSAQTQIPTADLANLYKSTTSRQISVHDPSVVWDANSKQFYIFGSHYFGGRTTDLRNWTAVSNYYNTTYDRAFKSNKARKVNRVLPGKTAVEEVDFPSFDAAAFCATYAGIKVGDREPTSEAQWVSGDQWAPDVVWNPNMNKWCYYVSLNGDYWASVVVLMTSDKIDGPYTYQGPVVFGGFNGQKYSGKSVDYKKTDLEIVLGTQSALPSRYRTDRWGTYYPNCIDPCAFFDEEGELWLVYGSWSGGIWGLKLDKNTGLRDYTYTYKGTGSSPDANGDDAYFGKRVAGGYYVSGEGPYIQHIGNHYYLFMSYGFFDPNGGYEMRVFRSENPLGPYKDANGAVATYGSYMMNYGPRAATNKGMKLLSAMNGWGNMTVGECAQGHNSACVDEKGRSFLVCHTKFNNGTYGHSVRTYQMYLNKAGWLCAAPFQFAGEETTDEMLATTQPFSAADIEGDYNFLIHPYKLDYEKYQEATPFKVHLSADGKITGDKTGTWKYTDDGASYVQLVIGGATYSGVVVEQTLENNVAKTLCFTAVCNTAGNASCGVPLWGYKLQPQAAIAYNYQQHNSSFKLTNLATVNSNRSIMFDPTDGVKLTWTSSNPERLSETGKYNPGKEEETVTMNARLECGKYYWENTYASKVRAAGELPGDPYTGIVAYYSFDGRPNANAWNTEQTASFNRASSSSTAPVNASHYDRFGQVVHTYFAAQKSNSYVRMTNPLKDAEIDGFTVSLWVRRSDANQWDALWSFFDSMSSSAAGARLFLTGNTFLGFNDNNGNWIDVNNPNTKVVNDITPAEWRLVTVTYSKSNGHTIYIDGTKKSYSSYTTSSADKPANFNKQLVIDHVKSASFFYLGLGSFWGSADAMFDDLLIYNRELKADDVKALNAMMTRVNDFTPEGVEKAVSIGEITVDNVAATPSVRQGIYDLMGRKVERPTRGIYIVNGKKVLYK